MTVITAVPPQTTGGSSEPRKTSSFKQKQREQRKNQRELLVEEKEWEAEPAGQVSIIEQPIRKQHPSRRAEFNRSAL